MIDRYQNQFNPDYASPPGDTLLEVLESRGISQAELAQRMGKTTKHINRIVKGKSAITPETALELEHVLGISATFWNNRERQYREILARLSETQNLERYKDWLSNFPLRRLYALGWVNPRGEVKSDLQGLLDFFGIASPDQWREVWGTAKAQLRKSPKFKSDPYALSAWLQMGRIEASAIECQAFDPQKFSRALQEIRPLTREHAEVFRPLVTEICAKSGVAFVVIPELPKTRVCGASYWLNSNRAVIQLSLRYKTNDHFWFTMFHEAGHILYHGKKGVFVESDYYSDPKEDDANRFAADTLIPRQRWSEFLAGGRFSKAAITEFAKESNIAAGIIVGRLQREQKLPPNHCNDLKRRFAWRQGNPDRS